MSILPTVNVNSLASDSDKLLKFSKKLVLRYGPVYVIITLIGSSTAIL